MVSLCILGLKLKSHIVLDEAPALALQQCGVLIELMSSRSVETVSRWLRATLEERGHGAISLSSNLCSKPS